MIIRLRSRVPAIAHCVDLQLLQTPEPRQPKSYLHLHSDLLKLPDNPNRKLRKTPQWGLYQRENFLKTNKGEVPPFNTGMTPHISIPC